MNIGFIGLGIMGKPMAKNLIAAGHALTVFDINPAPVTELVALGAAAGASSMDVAAKCRLVVTMLPNSPHVKQAVLGETGVIRGAKAGDILVDMSSIAPRASQEIAAELALKGIEMLDAPVSGGEPKAVDGTLAIMAGGKPEVFESVKDILLKMGSSAVLCGGIGAGNVVKLANQIIVALNIAAVGEALVFASKAGADPAKVRQALMGGFAASRILEVHGERMVKRSFNPGFRIGLHQKDLSLALAGARALGVALPGTANAAQLMQACAANGMQDLDHSALVRALELMANHEVAKV